MRVHEVGSVPVPADPAASAAMCVHEVGSVPVPADPAASAAMGVHEVGSVTSCAIVGAGRLGTALAAALRAGGVEIDGPLGRGADPRGADAVLLCVPDAEIAPAAAAIAPGVPVGHCSGATGLDVLAGHEAFGLHPLMTVPREGVPQFTGAGAAVAGSTPRALAIATELAERLGMRAFVVADDDRAAYHAAASIASNFLVTLEGAAEQLAGTAGVDRDLLAPLVRAAVETWVRLGAEQALTGPIVRGDEATVARQRAAVQERVPDLVALYDAMVDATRALAGRPAPADATRALAGRPAPGRPAPADARRPSAVDARRPPLADAATPPDAARLGLEEAR
jgi:predicted short-subunit dehydrogenase-like oxidoreductase (DUF2520 family)